MVLNSNTLLPLHELTEEGKERYHEYLACITDELIFKADHPILYFLNYFRQLFKIDWKFVENRYNKIIDEIKENRK